MQSRQSLSSLLTTKLKMSTSDTSFLDLPAEMLMIIIEKLDERDRMSLASVNKLLFNSDLMAGHRRFESVHFESEITCYTVARCNIKTKSGRIMKIFNRYTPIDEMSAFFNKSKTECLIITGHFDEIYERMVQRIMKIIDFEKLIIDVKSARTVKVIVCWKIAETTTGLAKKMILNLPDIVKHSMIVFNCGDRFIDDEIFLHLLRKSSGKIIIVCENGKITNAAIGAAFEMISSDMKKEEIILCVNKVATMNYRLDLKSKGMVQRGP
ncbi:hypothetical protein PRIPAC_90865 [Pristionchus pacificus]|uniref:F-box domain-containing protein n=1 Tax=Pristionchus pacificus TaxID=54126 RepID=A0A2A6B9F7_PRIPA|nr:hypothetical protein PRIPAC_90865 [Pristionchus pacificus]|eukprot:PDM62491.1 hypothetical protein PRIPAC_51933 [Pristionchus pacificus]